MTAIVDFILQVKSDVWTLPNAAVIFTPTKEMMQSLKSQKMSLYASFTRKD